jgi:very-short-patch-repair endonuclease
MTPQEVKVWIWLRERMNVLGWRFRRQVRIGRYVVDFANLWPRVVVEIDGDSHFVGTGPEGDRERDAYLRSMGFVVIRFMNAEIGRDGTVFVDAHQARFVEAGVKFEDTAP